MIFGEKKEGKKNKDNQDNQDNQEINVEEYLDNFKQVTFKDSLIPFEKNKDKDNTCLQCDSVEDQTQDTFTLIFKCLEMKYFSRINEKQHFLLLL